MLGFHAFFCIAIYTLTLIPHLRSAVSDPATATATVLRQLEDFEAAILKSNDENQIKMLRELKNNTIIRARAANILSNEQILSLEKKHSAENVELFNNDLKQLMNDLSRLGKRGESASQIASALKILQTRIDNLRKNGFPAKVNEVTEQYSSNPIFNCTQLSFNDAYLYCENGSYCKKLDVEDPTPTDYSEQAKAYLNYRFGLNEIIRATGHIPRPHSTE